MDEQFLVDWNIIMAGARQWLAGGNPYGVFPKTPDQLMHAGEFAYPPSVLFLTAPLTLLPLFVSGILMLLLSVIGFEYWTRQTSKRSGLFWLLLWLPFAQGLLLGQVTLLGLVGIALAEMAYTRQRDRVAGLLLALVLLKPQTIILPVGWLLVLALWQRRWQVLLIFGLASAVLWGVILAISGPEIYQMWFVGLTQYGPQVPHRPLLTPPVGLLVGLLAGIFWWRAGRNDIWGSLLLLNTLLLPYSITYAIAGIAFVVIRWRSDWPWYPLILSWIIPVLFIVPRIPDALTMLTQAIAITGLLAGLAPTLRSGQLIWWNRLVGRHRNIAS